MANNTLDYLDDIEIYVESNDLDAFTGWLKAQLEGFQTRA